MNYSKANNLVTLGTFTVLCKIHLYLVTKYFHHPKMDPVSTKQLLPKHLFP